MTIHIPCLLFFIKKVPAAEWVYAHVFLDQESKANLSFSYYPSGHMFYVEKASFDQFREQAGLWYQGLKQCENPVDGT